jgi:hypothetical protein
MLQLALTGREYIFEGVCPSHDESVPWGVSEMEGRNANFEERSCASTIFTLRAAFCKSKLYFNPVSISPCN